MERPANSLIFDVIVSIFVVRYIAYQLYQLKLLKACSDSGDSHFDMFYYSSHLVDMPNIAYIK